MNEILIILKFISIVFGGILAGFIGSLTGLGGGTVLVPLLSIFYGVPIVFATGASLISTIATSAGSASAYTKEKIANIKIGVGLEVATTIGAVVGSLLMVYLDHHALTWLIYIIFGVVLLGSLIPAVKRGQSELPPHTRPDWTTRVFELSGKYHDARLKKDVSYNGIRWWLGEIIMFFAGTISGLLGIGSGALKVLGMDWAMNLPMKVTTTTSNFMIGITAATGSSIYWYSGEIQIFIAAATAIGVVIGAYFGAKALVKITNKDIRWIFLAILSFLGVEMIIRGFVTDSIFILVPLIQFLISILVAVVFISVLYVHNQRKVKSVETL
ncbi:MAG: permease [Thermoplasmatales archaeon B_DKE]|nr:MAG: permease [Thermoplasmatales archaeon B_DKE]